MHLACVLTNSIPSTDMPSSKKPRKKHRPDLKPVHTPMMKSNRDHLALGLYIAVDNLIQRPSPETFERLSMILKKTATAIRYMQTSSIIARSFSSEQAIVEQMLLTMGSVEARTERVGKVGVSEDEALVLCTHAAVVDQVLGRIPKNVFQAASAQVAAESAGA